MLQSQKLRLAAIRKYLQENFNQSDVDLLDDAYALSEKDSSFSKGLEKWLNAGGTTVLRDVMSPLGNYWESLDFSNNVDAMDAAYLSVSENARSDSSGIIFVSNYQGESDYKYLNQRYRVRNFGLDYGDYNEGVYESNIIPSVGTVMGFIDEYPPEAVMAKFPGYVAGRYNRETKRIETQEPSQVINHNVGAREGFKALAEHHRSQLL